ncbi:6-phosphogluconolactonase [Pleionea litopenaei]|uniref:6-phosphogluconolactonase n=1 Tax=Pleionea litopenaei TaxID=3070815 RepID=A0AA51X7J8_9GAMM|nr:6-phosphogluconolactonase [Pleionea sp. HL-JVS1]WMS87190.1 6-phosphogluconolactonase [Pleionea sp. HL-JVS1]
MTLELAGLHYFDDRESANRSMAEKIASDLASAINERDKASLWVSGGSTPMDMYRKLSVANLPWRKVLISMVDERYVPPTDEASNERLIKENLLINGADVAEFVPFFQVTESPASNQQQLEATLREKVHGALDVVVLGMGNDGHTASLFPCAEEIEQVVSAENSDYTAVTHPRVAPHARLTLTLNRLLASRHIYLLLFGEDKLNTLKKAEQNGEEIDMPIRYFLRNQQPRLEIFWAP